MKRYRYYTADVFTRTRFGGNPLAVVLDAEGLTDDDMRRIAREFNYSESTFVLPPDTPGHDAKVRIFMPAQEIPFAGHPNVGTAFVLAATGGLGALADGDRMLHFEEQAGTVPVRVRVRDGVPVFCELTAPQPLALGETLPAERVAAALGILPTDVVQVRHPPQVVSVGLPAVIVEVRDRSVLARLTLTAEGWSRCTESAGAVLVHARDGAADRVRCRMFAPGHGIPEDPATGSAVCALAGVLAHHDPGADADRTYHVRQGVEMGRPSELLARVEKRSGVVRALRVGGPSVLVMEGWLRAD